MRTVRVFGRAPPYVIIDLLLGKRTSQSHESTRQPDYLTIICTLRTARLRTISRMALVARLALKLGRDIRGSCEPELPDNGLSQERLESLPLNR